MGKNLPECKDLFSERNVADQQIRQKWSKDLHTFVDLTLILSLNGIMDVISSWILRRALMNRISISLR